MIRVGHLAGVEVLVLKIPVVVFFFFKISVEVAYCYRQSICLQRKIQKV